MWIESENSLIRRISILFGIKTAFSIASVSIFIIDLHQGQQKMLAASFLLEHQRQVTSEILHPASRLAFQMYENDLH